MMLQAMLYLLQEMRYLWYLSNLDGDYGTF